MTKTQKIYEARQVAIAANIQSALKVVDPTEDELAYARELKRKSWK